MLEFGITDLFLKNAVRLCLDLTMEICFHINTHWKKLINT